MHVCMHAHTLNETPVHEQLTWWGVQRGAGVAGGVEQRPLCDQPGGRVPAAAGALPRALRPQLPLTALTACTLLWQPRISPRPELGMQLAG